MSWLNGAILSPRDLLVSKSIDVGATYKFGDDVKLWLDIGVSHTAITAMVAGVTIGAEGRVHYKLALPIADTGLFSSVEVPSVMVTGPEVTEFNGFDWGTPSEDIQKVFGQKSVSISEVLPETKGFIIESKAFSKVAKHSPRLATLLLHVANKTMLGKQSNLVDFDLRVVLITPDSFLVRLFGNEVKIFGVHDFTAFPLKVGFSFEDKENYVIWQYSDVALMEQKFVEDLVHFFSTGKLNGVGQ